MPLHVQPGLEFIGWGTGGFTYVVNEGIVLKTCNLWTMPPDSEPFKERYYYAVQLDNAYWQMTNERATFRRLAAHDGPSSPYLVQALTCEFDEGIYLERHVPLSQCIKDRPPQPGTRIQWYCDLLKGLVHLHDLDIVHGDIRIDNVLVNTHGTALLCDFGASGPFGSENYSSRFEGEPLGLNGLSKTLSDATDRYALASLIYELERGSRPLFQIEHGEPIWPPCNTGSPDLDTLVLEAWRGELDSTAQMLQRVEILVAESSSPDPPPATPRTSADFMADIDDFRKERISKFGCVLDEVPSEEMMRQLRKQYFDKA